MSQTLRGACTGAALAIAAVILYESTQERGRPGIPDLSTNEAYLGHFAIYTVMTFCILVATAPRSLASIGLVLLTCAGLGIALELYQAQLTTRTASAGDALADAAGAAAGLAAYVALMVLMEPSRQRQTTKS